MAFSSDQTAGKPEVGLAVLFVIGIHRDGKILQPLFVSLIGCLLLGDILVHVGDLAPDHDGHDIGDTVIVSNLLVLVPWRGLPALGRPFSSLVIMLFYFTKIWSVSAFSSEDRAKPRHIRHIQLHL